MHFMKKTVIILMLITVFSKLVGFSRDVVLASFYGASNISDAYLISLTIPIVIFSMVGIGISTAYIPMFSSIEKNEGSKKAIDYTSNLINFILLICTVIIVLSYFNLEFIVRLFASGFSVSTFQLTIQFTKITLFGIYFSSVIYILQGYLQIRSKFIIPALIGLPMNIVFLLSIVISKSTSLSVLSIGSVVATASQLFLLIPLALKSGYTYKPLLNIKDRNLKEMGMIALPVMLGVSVNEINVLVDRTLASQISVGGISALTYANRLNGFVVSIFVISIATVIFPKISAMAAVEDFSGLKKALEGAINSISILLVPATLGSMLFSKQIVQLLFGRGAFNADAINMTSNALLFYSIGMLGYSYREIIARGFYALKDTSTPVKNATFGVVLNIILNFLLSKVMGISGLALATSIASTFTCILLFISLRKKIGRFGIKKISISFIKVLFSSIIMSLVSQLTFNYFITVFSQNISLILAIGIGIVSYIFVISFMKIEDVQSIMNAVQKRFRTS